MNIYSYADFNIPCERHAAIIVGSGAAGFSAACELMHNDIDTLLLTEGVRMGTSRNTGSDKQTYYKLTLTGGEPDSIYSMAKNLFEGGSMHGDLALCEAANSARAFFRLVNLGVPFPVNEYGEFAGYMTDHDKHRRATSCGPLTSKYMTEALEAQARRLQLPIADNYRSIGVISDGRRCCGILAMNPERLEYNPLGLKLFLADYTVYAVGGPSSIYYSSVYPESQTCAHGAAFLAGASGVNLTESQYGLASIDFRWNLSGTYQQVIPRYFSTDSDGRSNPREFLPDQVKGNVFDLTFLKGYQWPFDPRKCESGSSQIDLAVYRELRQGRRVFMDFTANPKGFSPDALSDEAREYLSASGALDADTPLKRLKIMNAPAIELYRSHGIDLSSAPLEIAVCAQHNNGGLYTDMNYESVSLANFYPIGECCGVFGVYRPGGSALNSTQVSSLRAAEHITRRIRSNERFGEPDKAALDGSLKQLSSLLARYDAKGALTTDDILAQRREAGLRMDTCGAFIRDPDEVSEALARIKAELASFGEGEKVASPSAFRELAINFDSLITQYVYLSAIDDYIVNGGGSRGSYLIPGRRLDTRSAEYVRSVRLEQGEPCFCCERARPIPSSEQWFETVYNRYLNR